MRLSVRIPFFVMMTRALVAALALLALTTCSRSGSVTFHDKDITNKTPFALL